MWKIWLSSQLAISLGSRVVAQVVVYPGPEFVAYQAVLGATLD